MQVNFVGKNIKLRENFKEQTLKKLNRLDKYFDDTVHANVAMSEEGNQKRVEVTIRVSGNGGVFRADQLSYDMMQSVDQCVESLVSQIRKYKTKLQKRWHNNRSIRFEFIEDLPEEEQSHNEPDIARVKEIEMHPMSAEEAALQMEMLNHDFFLFMNADTGEVNVVYRRRAGNYGLLMPAQD